MQKFFNKHPMLQIYILSSLVGNIFIYLCFNWNKFEVKDLTFTVFATVVGFFIGYGILKLITIIYKIDKEGYEYRKKHPSKDKDEPW